MEMGTCKFSVSGVGAKKFTSSAGQHIFISLEITGPGPIEIGKEKSVQR